MFGQSSNSSKNNDDDQRRKEEERQNLQREEQNREREQRAEREREQRIEREREQRAEQEREQRAEREQEEQREQQQPHWNSPAAPLHNEYPPTQNNAPGAWPLQQGNSTYNQPSRPAEIPVPSSTVNRPNPQVYTPSSQSPANPSTQPRTSAATAAPNPSRNPMASPNAGSSQPRPFNYSALSMLQPRTSAAMATPNAPRYPTAAPVQPRPFNYSALSMSAYAYAAPAVQPQGAALQDGSFSTASVDSQIQKLRSQIYQLRVQEATALDEMRHGLYCSQCHRSKTELEESGINFEEHLKEVHGVAVPASQAELDAKQQEYDQKISDLEQQLSGLESQRQQLVEQHDQFVRQGIMDRANQIVQGYRNAAQNINQSLAQGVAQLQQQLQGGAAPNALPSSPEQSLFDATQAESDLSGNRGEQAGDTGSPSATTMPSADALFDGSPAGAKVGIPVANEVVIQEVNYGHPPPVPPSTYTVETVIPPPRPAPSPDNPYGIEEVVYGRQSDTAQVDSSEAALFSAVAQSDPKTAPEPQGGSSLPTSVRPATVFGDPTAPPAQLLQPSPPAQQAGGQVYADDRLQTNYLGLNIDPFLEGDHQPGREPSDNVPMPKQPGESGSWMQKSGLQISAWVNSFLFLNANVVAFICNANGEASWTGSYLKIENAGPKPFYFSAAGFATHMPVGPGESFLTSLAYYRSAADANSIVVINMDVYYWKSTP